MKRIFLVVAAMAVGSFAMQAQNAASTGDADNGKKLWVKYNCYTCHGYEGHGGAGAKLAPKPIAVTAFMGVVRHPPKSSMPTFSAKLVPDSDLRDMWAYLNSIPATAAAKDVPLLSGIQ